MSSKKLPGVRNGPWGGPAGVAGAGFLGSCLGRAPGLGPPGQTLSPICHKRSDAALCGNEGRGPREEVEKWSEAGQGNKVRLAGQ